MGINYFGQPDAALPTVQKAPKPMLKRVEPQIENAPGITSKPDAGTNPPNTQGTVTQGAFPEMRKGTQPATTKDQPRISNRGAMPGSQPPTTKDERFSNRGYMPGSQPRPTSATLAVSKMADAGINGGASVPQFGRFQFKPSAVQEQRASVLKDMSTGEGFSRAQNASQQSGGGLPSYGPEVSQKGAVASQDRAGIIQSMLGGNEPAGAQSKAWNADGFAPIGQSDARASVQNQQQFSRADAIRELLDPKQSMGKGDLYVGGGIPTTPEPTQTTDYYGGADPQKDTGTHEVKITDFDGDGTISQAEKDWANTNPDAAGADNASEQYKMSQTSGPDESLPYEIAPDPATAQDAPVVGGNKADPLNQGYSLYADQALADALQTADSTDWQNLYNTQAQAIQAGAATQQNKMAAELAARGLGSSGMFVQGTNEIGANTQTALNDLAVKVETQKIDTALQQIQNLLAFKGKEMDDATKRDLSNQAAELEQQKLNLQADQQQEDQKTAAIEGVQAMAYNYAEQFGIPKEAAGKWIFKAIEIIQQNNEPMTADNLWKYFLEFAGSGLSY